MAKTDIVGRETLIALANEAISQVTALEAQVKKLEEDRKRLYSSTTIKLDVFEQRCDLIGKIAAARLADCTDLQLLSDDAKAFEAISKTASGAASFASRSAKGVS